MANWWDGFAPATTPRAQPGGGAPFLTPQAGGGGMFAGLPAEALLVAGMSGPAEGMKFLAPFMTQAPIEVMGPDGRPQLMSPWQARGFATPTSTLGFMREGREQRGQDFNQRLDTQKFDLERDKHLFDKDYKTRTQAVDEANRPVLPGAVPGAPPVVNPGPVDAQTRAAAAKESLDRIYKQSDVAREAQKGIRAIHEGRKLLDQGATVGFGADFRVGFGKALQAAGLAPPGDRPEDNAQAYVAAMAQQVFATIKNLGSGSGISDADREFARQAAGGSIQLTEGALHKILDIGEKAGRTAIESYRAQAQPLIDSGQLPAWTRGVMTIPEPPQYQGAPRPATPPPAGMVPANPGSIPGGPLPPPGFTRMR